MKNKSISILVSLLVLLPSLAFAAGLIPSDVEIAANGFGALGTLANNILNWFISISVSVATITAIYAGANILLHPENPDEIKKGKEMLKKTVIGMLIILAAWLVVHTIVSALVSNSSSALRFLGK